MNQSSTDRPVVVGVRAQQAGLLDFAAGLAEAYRSPLRVVHSCHAPYPYGYGPYTPADLPDSIVAPARRVLDEAQKHLEPAGLRADIAYELVVGFPPAVLGAESSGAKAVVVGTDDIGWLDRITGEAVTNFLCLHSQSPIVVVPPSVESFAIDEVVVAVSGRSAETGPLQFAFELADRVAVDVRVVHVMSHHEATEDVDEARVVLAETVAGWTETYPDVTVSTVLTQGHDPAEETARIAGERSLVVAGRPEGGPLRRWRSPVTRSLAGAGRQPVAVVPPHPVA